MYTIAQNTIATANKAVLRNLCKQYHIKNYGNMNNSQMRTAINNTIMQRDLFAQGVSKAHKPRQLPSLLPPMFNILGGLVPQIPKPTVTQKRTKQRVKNGQWHPKMGGKTYAVWVQMRYALAVKKLPLKAAKAYVRNYFQSSNVHFNTVNAQIYRFCKYYGLTGK